MLKQRRGPGRQATRPLEERRRTVGGDREVSDHHRENMQKKKSSRAPWDEDVVCRANAILSVSARHRSCWPDESRCRELWARLRRSAGLGSAALREQSCSGCACLL
ncbi:hypothetical protein AOLI_G00129980 [Acnodon oligacanthus]